jgi:hypothetical protein
MFWLSIVGDGAGSLFRGAGEGLGHFFGGLTGGGSTIVKGVGKSIMTGDGSAMTSGLVEGVGHMGRGIRSSVVAVGSGVSGSVTSVVGGSVKGVKQSLKESTASTTTKKQQRDLAKLRKEFQKQDFS